MGDVTISVRDEQPVAVIRSSSPMTELGQRLGVILPTVHATIIEQGRVSTQPPFMRYFAMDMANGSVDFEAGFPVDAPIRDAGQVLAATLPGGEIASLWHLGPYQELGSSHDRLDTWIASNGRQQGDGRWEVYWTDPGEEPDPAKWRTDTGSR